MFLDERREKILETLNRKGKVYVKDLAEEFLVGEGMIRKDLQALEKEGKLKRTYGGAINKTELVHSTSLNERLEEHSEAREIIAEKVFKLIEDGDTIFLDISSTNSLLAKKLSKSSKKILIITNMPSIMSFFTETNYIELILIGGTYNKKIGGTVGSEAIKAISNYKIDKAFIGSCGINFDSLRVTNFDLEDGNTKRMIIENSNKKYLLAESNKFNLEGFYSYAELKDFDYMLTEIKISQEIGEKTKGINIKVL